MTVHDISEHEQARAAYVPKRGKNWRKDWERRIYWPEYDSTWKRWSIRPLMMLALHEQGRAAFQLDYGPDHLLCGIQFLSGHSESPSLDWKLNGPEMCELISQITELYLRRW